MSSSPDPIVTVTRGGIVESFHHGDIVLATPDGVAAVVAGSAEHEIYPRSALKPFQALAVLEQLGDLGTHLEPDQLAITCASHDGSDDAQIAAAALLAEAGLDESALRCPADWPIDTAVTAQLDGPTTLSHNCSGKHAGMLRAHVAAGHDPATYLDPSSVLQQRVARWLAEVFGAPPGGPSVDGCGAPTWRTSVGALATAFAKLAASERADMAQVHAAMTAHPRLVGGRRLPDTRLMEADGRVIAKRGAEAVMGAGITTPRNGPIGVAVKVYDGGDRAAGPAVAAALLAVGAVVPPTVLRPVVLGGGVQQGTICATPRVASSVTRAFGLA